MAEAESLYGGLEDSRARAFATSFQTAYKIGARGTMELRSGTVVNATPSPAVVEPTLDEGWSSGKVLDDGESALSPIVPELGDGLAAGVSPAIKKQQPLAKAVAAARKAAAKEKEEPVVKEEEEGIKCIAITTAGTRCKRYARVGLYCVKHAKMMHELYILQHEHEQEVVEQPWPEEPETVEPPTPEPEEMDDEDELAAAFGAATIA